MLKSVLKCSKTLCLEPKYHCDEHQSEDIHDVAQYSCELKM